MCGIVGSVNFKLNYNKVNKAMLHRGPDEQNNFVENNIDFYHLRLSILDIGGGKQPMKLNENLTIIFNGEIYNHLEIRKKYQLQGNTNSDTETILLLYQKFGTDFLNEVDGMFAFAIYDSIKNEIFIARDRAGKKPLYYYIDNQKFIFASELNCLASLLPLNLNEAHFLNYLRLGTFYKSETPYKNVYELEAGSILTINCNTLQLTTKKWWNINNYYLQLSNDTEQIALQKVEKYLELSIKRRIESSDLEVGCFLSGGIDSGLVTAIASKHKHNLKTFTVSFPGEYNEAPLAKLVAQKYNTYHTEININFNNLRNDIESILKNYGEPFFDSSAIPSYYVCKEAKKHVTVILNGDGADEIFAGYRRYVPFAHYDFFKQNSFLKASALATKKILPLSNDKKSKYNFLYRLLTLASKSNLNTYLSAGVDLFEDFESNILTTEDYTKQMQFDFESIINQPLTGLQKIMNIDFDTNLCNDLLVKMDIASMSNSLEGRSPFLSKELLEYAPTLNDKFKINGKTTKYLLRELAKKYLPFELVKQPKRGFEIPLKHWIDNELKEIIIDYLNSSNALYPKFIKKEFVENILENKIKIGLEKRAKIIWAIFCMEVWYQKKR